MSDPQPTMTDELTYCAVHPDRETSLRCNKCNRYMCPECAVQTPVGYRCKQCVRQQEDKFFTATQQDYILTFVVTGALSGLGAAIVSALSVPILFVLILGLPIGAGIGEMALRATQRRRGRRSNWVAVGGVVVGGFLGALIRVYLLFASMAGGASPLAIPFEMTFYLVWNDFSLLIFIAIAAIAVYGRYQMKI